LITIPQYLCWEDIALVTADSKTAGNYDAADTNACTGNPCAAFENAYDNYAAWTIINKSFFLVIAWLNRDVCK